MNDLQYPPQNVKHIITSLHKDQPLVFMAKPIILTIAHYYTEFTV